MSSYIIILTTTPSVKVAQQIAQALVQEHLAACVNIIPNIKSYYIWQNKLCRDKETLLLIKTTRTRFKSIEGRIKQLHPYQIPEIISLDIKQGNKTYLGWISRCSSGSPDNIGIPFAGPPRRENH
jgi:periplasmic divalent cation tolerance protein